MALTIFTTRDYLIKFLKNYLYKGKKYFAFLSTILGLKIPLFLFLKNAAL